jgi:hypothetical protein
MSGSSPELDQILAQEVFIRGANRPFGELTLQDARARADELRAATGWGPTIRVAPVAHAWRELTMTMERAGAANVSQLDPEVVVELSQRLWIVLPGGAMMSCGKRPLRVPPVVAHAGARLCRQFG